MYMKKREKKNREVSRREYEVSRLNIAWRKDTSCSR